MRRHNILGVGIHNCGEDEAISEVKRFLTKQPSKLHQVCTVNPEFVMEARRNPTFHRIINNAALATPDGIGIILAGRLLRRPFKGRATGVAIVERIARLSNEQGHSIFMLGAGEGVAEQAADALKQRHPRIIIAGTYAGSPDDKDFEEIKTRLDATRPDILFVAYGAPKQDLWIDTHRPQFPSSIKIAMGVGGVFDYLSGRVPLAPSLMRRLGLEWLYRLIKQPWRWRRILKVLAFAFLTIKTALLSPKTIHNSRLTIMALDPTTTDYDSPMYCPRHPNEQTYLRCGKCERPICAKCRVSTPVGFRCFECANLQVLPTYAVDSSVYVRAGIAGLVVATLVGVFMGFFPDFEFWTALIMGLAVPEAVATGASQKRGPGLQMVGVGCIFAGFVVSRVVMGALGAFSFTGISLLDGLPFYLTQYSVLWLALMIFLTYKRLQ